jgi:hypothetical protein
VAICTASSWSVPYEKSNSVCTSLAVMGCAFMNPDERTYPRSEASAKRRRRRVQLE